VEGRIATSSVLSIFSLQMEQLEEVQQALWNADFMKVTSTDFLSMYDSSKVVA
jgi:hypothetical protein